MNIDPRLFDFERTAIYTRKKTDIPQQPQATYQAESIQLGRGYQPNFFTPNRINLEDSRISYQTKKDYRNDQYQQQQNRFTPMPCAQAYPVFQNQNNPFFYNNVPQNTRLNEMNGDYKS